MEFISYHQQVCLSDNIGIKKMIQEAIQKENLVDAKVLQELIQPQDSCQHPVTRSLIVLGKSLKELKYLLISICSNHQKRYGYMSQRPYMQEVILVYNQHSQIVRSGRTWREQGVGGLVCLKVTSDELLPYLNSSF